MSQTEISHMDQPATAAGSLPVILVALADVVNANSVFMAAVWGRLRPNNGHQRRPSALLTRVRTHRRIGFRVVSISANAVMVMSAQALLGRVVRFAAGWFRTVAVEYPLRSSETWRTASGTRRNRRLSAMRKPGAWWAALNVIRTIYKTIERRDIRAKWRAFGCWVEESLRLYDYRTPGRQRQVL